jgi:hypothetical protein
MAVGTGTLFLNGTSAQAVNGSQAFKTYNLNSNNSAGITLNNDLSVTGTHTFTSGVIATSLTPNYLVYEVGSSYTGDGDTKHVNGWVKKFGSTNFVFPVGNGTVERTVSVNTLSASSEFNVKYAPTTPNPYVMISPVHDVDKPEYWIINKISGGTAIVTLNWNYAKVYFPNYVVADILVAGYNGAAWIDDGGAGTATGNASTTGSVTSSAISSFNLFTFGSRTYVLAMTLVNFSATRQNGSTQLQWTTEREYNTDRFIVERSDNGVSFYAIDQVAARNTNTTQQYSSRDNSPISGVVYYRLRWIDVSGKENYSQIVAVKESDTTAHLMLVANPVHNKVVLSASGDLNGNFNYRVMNAGGQLVQQGNINIQNSGQYEIPLNNFSTGNYILDVSNSRQNFRYKIAVR